MDSLDGTNYRLRCDFCGEVVEDPRDAIAGTSSFICRKCIETVHADALHRQRCRRELEVKKDDTGNIVEDNIKRPMEIRDELDQYVIGQDEAKRKMAVAVYHHYLRVKRGLPTAGRNNVMLIGPTGSGKTYLMQTIAKIVGLPLVIYDSTGLTEAGYVGRDTDDILSSLLSVAGGDVDLAKKGIVFIDEIDKKADRTNPGTGRDVSGKSVQQTLLKMIEGGTYNLTYGNKPVKMDTSSILFVFGGAFSDLVTYSVKETKNKIGLGHTMKIVKETEYQDVVDKIDHRDLIAYGMIPEFIGRVPIIVKLKKLEIPELRSILTDVKGSVIEMTKEIFDVDGIKVEIPEETLLKIAKVAFDNGSGARGLRTIVEHSLFDMFYELPSSKVTEFTFDVGMVTDLK